jgi:hypothetical protein
MMEGGGSQGLSTTIDRLFGESAELLADISEPLPERLHGSESASPSRETIVRKSSGWRLYEQAARGRLWSRDE